MIFVSALTLLILAVLNGALFAETHVFGEGENQFEIEFVLIHSPGNQPDNDPLTYYPTSDEGTGAVDYEYQIGKYETTCSQVDKVGRSGGYVDVGRPASAFANSTCTDPERPNAPMSYPSTPPEVRAFVNWLNVSAGFPPAYSSLTGPAARNSDARYFLPRLMNGTRRRSMILPTQFTMTLRQVATKHRWPYLGGRSPILPFT